ncbi:MAG: response regulator, partial [Patescibacteria group bacterium]
EVKKSKPDLILLDIKMPKMDGIEFLKEMNEKYGGIEIPVLVTSNNSSLEKISEGMSLGIRGYFVKSNESLQGITEMIDSVFKK